MGAAVRAEGVLVESVPADEGFWIRCGPLRLWVELAGPGESAVTVRTGQRLRLVGTLAARAPDQAAPGGLGREEGGGDPASEPVHIDAEKDSLSVG